MCARLVITPVIHAITMGLAHHAQVLGIVRAVVRPATVWQGTTIQGLLCVLNVIERVKLVVMVLRVILVRHLTTVSKATLKPYVSAKIDIMTMALTQTVELATRLACPAPALHQQLVPSATLILTAL